MKTRSFWYYRDCKKNWTGLMCHYAKTINNRKFSYTLILYKHIVGNFQRKKISISIMAFDILAKIYLCYYSLLGHFYETFFLCKKKFENWLHIEGYGSSRGTSNPIIQSKILSALKLCLYFYCRPRIEPSRANLLKGGKFKRILSSTLT